MDWTDVVDEATRRLEVVQLGPSSLVARIPGSPRVMRMRRRKAGDDEWIQLLVPVAPARNANWSVVLHASLDSLIGAPAIDEATLVLREALLLRVATWSGIRQIASRLCAEADRMAARLVARRDMTVSAIFED